MMFWLFVALGAVLGVVMTVHGRRWLGLFKEDGWMVDASPIALHAYEMVFGVGLIIDALAMVTIFLVTGKAAWGIGIIAAVIWALATLVYFFGPGAVGDRG